MLIIYQFPMQLPTDIFFELGLSIKPSINYFKIQAFIKSGFSHLSNSFTSRKLFYCGCHVSLNPLVCSHSIGNNRRCTTAFCQSLVTKLHCYHATIRGSKSSILLFQVYFAVSLLPFGMSHQPM